MIQPPPSPATPLTSFPLNSLQQQQQQHSQIQALLQQPTLQMPPTSNNNNNTPQQFQRPPSSENQMKPIAPLTAMSNISQQLHHPQPPATPPHHVTNNNNNNVVTPSLAQNRFQKQVIHQQQSEHKKEPLFPFDSIEATQVNEVKKRKITSKDITPCDPWKLYLCLKSGLLSESTWALDALNILLFDDQTTPYFHLKHFPGLIKILLEHYVKCLKELFKEEFDNNRLLDELYFDENIDQNGEDVNDESASTVNNKNRQKYKENGVEESEECESEQEDVVDDDDEVFKLLFNDKEMNKFCSYYKNGSISKSDSRSSVQLSNYSQKVVEKYLNKGRKKHKKEQNLTNKNHKQSYLKTHLNTSDELIKMEKLFFGQKSFDQKRHTSCCNRTTVKKEEEEEEEEQAVIEEECLFKILSQKDEELMQRCMCISTVIRNLTFVPGNDVELCKNTAFITIIGTLLKFKHKHNYKNVHESEHGELNGGESIELNNEWWWECAYLIRENTLVTVSNISSALDLNKYNENIIKSFIDGLIHWSICKSSDTIDALNTLSDTSTISAQRLAIESLSKMTIFDVNVDLILATISNYELDSLFSILSEWLIRRDEQTLREFSIVLLTSIAKCDQLSTKLITKYFSLLVTFLEDFEEQTRLLLAQQSHHHNPYMLANNHHHHHHHHHNNNSPFSSDHLSSINGFHEDNLGTTTDMLIRCANCLVHLSVVPDNVSTIIKYQERLLDLSTSQYIDYNVSKKIAEVLYHCSNVNNQTNGNNRLFMPYT